MPKILCALVLWLLAGSPVHAQQNQCRTSPVGASTAYCASEAFVTQTAAAGGTVTEQKNTFGYGLTSGGNCDNTSTNVGSPCDAAINLTTLSASLGADVLLTPAATFVPGPSVAQGTTGTFTVSGGITFLDTAAAQTVKCRLWDGATVIDSRSMTTSAAGFVGSVFLSGKIVNPAGNLRISCKSTAGTTASMLFNQTGDGKDSSITAIRIN